MNQSEPACPLPWDHDTILLAHGGGGRLMHRLINDVFLAEFGAVPPVGLHDGALLDIAGGRIAFTTDTYVVRPLFFPGGDIGTLAVYGTVNDLAMCGARPLYLSVGMILEEGTPIATVRAVAASIRAAATAAQVRVVTGDTKVVERGRGDGLYVNTAGIGVVPPDVMIAPGRVRVGDAVILSGDLGRHGIAIMAVREGLAFETTIKSDCAPLAAPVARLLDTGIDVHCLRDLTRGGLASALVEIAGDASVRIHIEERAIPITDDVRGACEILGLDPLHVANEGRFVAFVPAGQADAALTLLRAHAPGGNAAIIGVVHRDPEGIVTLTSVIGAERIVDMPSGEQLPRIC
ncbi:MAG: hydrogenase expression/formation protein HypE [Candidatus Zixiibacteriota bacterium]